MKELWRMVRQTRRIATLERLVDGQWRELAEAEDVVAAVMHDYEQIKAVLAVREQEIVALKRMLNEARSTWKN